MPDNVATFTLTDPDALHAYVRQQINELVGDQLRGATEDGYRLGLRSAISLGRALAEHSGTSDDQRAALAALIAALDAAADNVCLFGPTPAETTQEGPQ